MFKRQLVNQQFIFNKKITNNNINYIKIDKTNIINQKGGELSVGSWYNVGNGWVLNTGPTPCSESKINGKIYVFLSDDKYVSAHDKNGPYNQSTFDYLMYSCKANLGYTSKFTDKSYAGKKLREMVISDFERSIPCPKNRKCPKWWDF